MASIKLESNIEAIDISSTNEVAVASSKLTGKIWNGEIFVYQLSDNLELVQKRRIETNAGNASIKYVNLDHITTILGHISYQISRWLNAQSLLSAGDAGVVQLTNFSNPKQIKTKHFHGHHDIISSIDTNKTANSEQFVSSSWDLSIKLWNASSPHATNTFVGHTEFIWKVAFNPLATSTFASVSQDKTIQLWDVTKPTATSVIKVNVPLYSLSWNQVNQHILAVGGQDGSVQLFDTRNTTSPLVSKVIHSASVKEVAFDKHNENVIATGGDDNKIAILSTAENQLNVSK